MQELEPLLNYQNKEVVLLDIASNGEDRNTVVNSALKQTLKSKPASLYLNDPLFTHRIETGNFDDDLFKIKDCDWICEAIIERLDIKQGLFERVEQHRSLGTLITSNTSGIPS